MPRDTLRTVALVASTLLLVDLCLDWQRASVSMPGVVAVEAGSSGWSGVGLFAGIAALVVVGCEIARRTGHGERPGLTAWAAVIACGAVILAVLDQTSLVVAPHMHIAVKAGSTLWPAWVGLGLSLLAAAAAVAAAGGALTRERAPRTGRADGPAPPGRTPGRPPAPPAPR
jgi:hypothetical protein